MDMLSDRDDAVIVRSTVELGRSLGLRVVAEGVETVEHLERLRYFGCHVVQGFLISRPLPAVNVTAWLHERRSGALPAQGLPVGTGTVVPVGARVLEPLLDVAGLITDGVSLAEVLAALGGHLRVVVPHDDLVVYLLDHADHTLSAIHAEGESASETTRERFDAHEGITGAALREGRLRNVPRTDLDPDSVVVAGTVEEPEALVCCPMTNYGRPLGVLNVYRSGSSMPFSAAEGAVVERFSAVASLALRRDALGQPDGSTSRTAAWAAATRATGTR